jgi:dienelactone hydrolase
MKITPLNVLVLVFEFCTTALIWGDDLSNYFAAETRRMGENGLAEIKLAEDWEGARPIYRKQLFEMLSLDPLPAKSDLKPVITGRVEREGVVVEKLHFQSMPGNYVTANFYLPKEQSGNLPTILYVCGHGRVITNGVSYGNKVAYQHHGAWFARNGYACLVIDTLQLGEIQGLHHGTHREGMWWWNSRGYSSAGAEAWNCIRALDYLETRPEVDKNRIGVTGRSGGGAYSWWVAALDDRVKVAAPVAGITDLHNHVVDGVVEGHCDCMFFVNTYRWDYTMLPALVAPRPLLICNSDKDTIFPLDGVYHTHQTTARIYKLLNASTNLGLLITEGPHRDTQDLQVPVFRWFNRHFKKETGPVEMVAKPLFTGQELKVFSELPADEINTKLQEIFVPMAQMKTPSNARDWNSMRESSMRNLKEKVFRGWPESAAALAADLTDVAAKNGRVLRAGKFVSQENVPLSVYLVQPKDSPVESVHLLVPNENEWPMLVRQLSTQFGTELTGTAEERGDQTWEDLLEKKEAAVIIVAVRGVKPGSMPSDPKKFTHVRRRYMLLGQTLNSMRVWDIRRAVHFLQENPETSGKPIQAHATGLMAVNLLYASLYEPKLANLHLDDLPQTHMQGPDYLNVLRYVDIPEVLAFAASEKQITLTQTPESIAEFSASVAKALGQAQKIKLD